MNDQQRRHNRAEGEETTMEDQTPASTRRGGRRAESRRRERTAGRERGPGRARVRRRAATPVSELIANKVFCVIVDHGPPAARAGEEATDLAQRAPEQSPMAGRIGVLVRRENGNVEVRVPLTMLLGALRLSRLLPQGARDRVMDLLAQRGIDLEQIERPEANERIIHQLARLNIDVQTESTRVRVFTE